MRVEVIRAWPHRFESVTQDLPAGARVADALAACGFEGLEEASALAVHGVLVTPETVLNDGDRVEVLRPLQMDPKEARRRRARRTAP
ncbi:RnfH family protein [Pseudoxanthomonas sp. SL93]|mgnify:CR=1 FL=1|jgi:uncharacterized protein|uniref:RnfH family protein n=1 Tax=Pseudoxanthomonas sp. SL93 TaxID=2995142 RepID=UPI0022713F82|nr:RnfH family protein [Pseudoxanthomonas sp. SL93]WAC64131.1 RnfH family protein [Pseudoxanthomonas sp. SL93]